MWSQQATRAGSRNLLVQSVPPATLGVMESLGQVVRGKAGWGGVHHPLSLTGVWTRN